MHKGEKCLDTSAKCADFLRAFLALAEAGHSSPVPSHIQFAQKVKAYQRLSPSHKASWETFCTQKGTKRFDSLQKDTDFLRQFLESHRIGSNHGTTPI